MGCCSGPKSIEVIRREVMASGGESQVYMARGDNVSCWVNRAKPADDKSSEPQKGKITTASVVSDCAAKVDMTMQAEPPTGGTTTEWKLVGGTKTGSIYEKTFSNGTMKLDSISGKLTGTFTKPANESSSKEVTLPPVDLEVEATFSDGSSDAKKYQFAPTFCDPNSALMLKHPLPGSQITGVFGEVRDARGGGVRPHNGLDFSYGPGIAKTVVATADGEVAFVGVKSGYGNVIDIIHTIKGRHFMSRYSHLASTSVSEGTKVSGGQAIGMEGGTGRVPPYDIHLHFELHEGGKYIDPQPYFADVPTRLRSSTKKGTWTEDSFKLSGAKKQLVASEKAKNVTGGGTPQPVTAGNKVAYNPNQRAGGSCPPDSQPPGSVPNTSDGTPPVPCAGNVQVGPDFVTAAQLHAMMPRAGVAGNRMLCPINAAMKKHGITTKRDAAMFLANVAVETGELRYLAERGGEKYCSYLDYKLGNKGPGWGYKYRGRGLLHLTGVANYQSYMKGSGVDAVGDPDKLATDDDIACDSGAWFWKWRVQGTQDFGDACRKVNGRTKDGKCNGWDQRHAYYAKACAALGI